MVYKHDINWRSPTYASAAVTGAGQVTVRLNDVEKDGLVLKPPFNARAETNCAELNMKTPRTCAYAELQFDDAGATWVNATVALGAAKDSVLLPAPPPAGSRTVVAS